jgi:hypothetical protein
MKLNCDQRMPAFRTLGFVCVLLVCLAGFIAAVHAHKPSASSSERACSVCALANSGAIAVEHQAHAPLPVVCGYFEQSPERSPSFELFTSLYIRPPPQV